MLTSAAPCPQPGTTRTLASVAPLLSLPPANAMTAIDSGVGADLLDVGPPNDQPPQDRDDDRAREIKDREAAQDLERARGDEEQAKRLEQDQTDQQALVAATMAAHDQAVAEGAAYTEKRDREAAEAEAVTIELQAEEERNQPAAPPPPEASQPAPPAYRAPEGQDSEDTGEDPGTEVPPANSDTPAADNDSPADTANLPDPDDGWTPSEAPPPPPLQLDPEPTADPRYAQGYTEADIYREDHPDEFSAPEDLI